MYDLLYTLHSTNSTACRYTPLRSGKGTIWVPFIFLSVVTGVCYVVWLYIYIHNFITFGGPLIFPFGILKASLQLKKLVCLHKKVGKKSVNHLDWFFCSVILSVFLRVFIVTAMFRITIYIIINLTLLFDLS